MNVCPWPLELSKSKSDNEKLVKEAAKLEKKKTHKYVDKVLML